VKAFVTKTPSVKPARREGPVPLGHDEIMFLRKFVENLPHLRDAWIKLANANVEHLRLIKRVERRFTSLLGIALLQSLIVLVGIGAAVKFNVDAKREAIETRKAVVHAKSDLREFLHAQGATNKAITKRVQADVTRDPNDEQKAIEAAVEAEKETLDAQRAIAPPAKRPAIEREARKVEQRARAIKKKGASEKLESLPEN
jgi:hypothetical protein